MFGGSYTCKNSSECHRDPAITVTVFSDKPSCDCEVTISLTKDIVDVILDPGVAGLYKSTGSYRRGRPVLQHSEGRFMLSVYWDMGCWLVSDGVGGAGYLQSGSAPSQCPADPNAARGERKEETHWAYFGKKGWGPSSKGIGLTCHKHPSPDQNTQPEVLLSLDHISPEKDKKGRVKSIISMFDQQQ